MSVIEQRVLYIKVCLKCNQITQNMDVMETDYSKTDTSYKISEPSVFRDLSSATEHLQRYLNQKQVRAIMHTSMTILVYHHRNALYQCQLFQNLLAKVLYRASWDTSLVISCASFTIHVLFLCTHELKLTNDNKTKTQQAAI